MIGSLANTLLGINLLAYCMVILRPKLYKTKLYRPMLVNIKLSLMPLLVMMILVTAVVLLQALNAQLETSVFLWVSLGITVIGLGIWLLLLPNAGYLITELNFNHREHDAVEVPLWYDIISVLTLAMSGVMNMCFNVFIIEFAVTVLVRDALGDVSFLFDSISWIVVVALMALASFGIYLGRYIRFNSWDVKHPVQFLRKLRAHFAVPGSGKNCALFTLFHALFFIVFYRATVGVVLEELIASMTFLP